MNKSFSSTFVWGTGSIIFLSIVLLLWTIYLLTLHSFHANQVIKKYEEFSHFSSSLNSIEVGVLLISSGKYNYGVITANNGVVELKQIIKDLKINTEEDSNNFDEIVPKINELEAAYSTYLEFIQEKKPTNKELLRQYNQKIDNQLQSILDIREELGLQRIIIEHNIKKSLDMSINQYKNLRNLSFCIGILALISAILLGLFIKMFRKKSLLLKDSELREEKLRKLNINLKEMQLQLAQSTKMAGLGEMAGGIAHEINSPLATIKLLLEQINKLLSKQSFDVDLMSSLVKKIEKTSDRIAKIIQGLRTFSRDGKKDPFQEESLSHIIEDTAILCQERFKAHDIQLSIDPLPNNLKINCRATEISQVLLNILNNAYDAIMEKTEKEKWINVSVLENNEYIEIRIKDSGKGISLEIQQKIFQPFFTTKPVGKGTGLGLSISLGIIQNHSGEIKIDNSCPNTCFIVTLPKKLSAATDLAA